MRRRVDRHALRALIVVPLLLVHGADAARVERATDSKAASIELRGRAFGTTWTVTVAARPETLALAVLGSEVRTVLDGVDASMSTWRADSELARFNALRSTGWYDVSPELAHVVAAALDVHGRSEGAFDPTIAPVLALWGFGPASPRRLPPSTREVERTLLRVGGDRIRVRVRPPALRKLAPDVELDLSGVAKGHAVDAIAGRLESLGVRDYLVEVGGELRGRGRAPSGGLWQVGIERPSAHEAEPGWTVALSDASLATSGSYRNYFEAGGRRYAHVLDPRTGRPAQHRLASVSVRAPGAAEADAWATALLVMGPERGWRVAEREGLAVLFVLAREDGLEARATPALEPYRGR